MADKMSNAELASVAERVLSVPERGINYPRYGDWFAIGGAGVAVVIDIFHFTAGWVFLGAIAIGWAINERYRSRANG